MNGKNELILFNIDNRFKKDPYCRGSNRMLRCEFKIKDEQSDRIY
jgi:hypothetical protein